MHELPVWLYIRQATKGRAAYMHAAWVCVARCFAEARTDAQASKCQALQPTGSHVYEWVLAIGSGRKVLGRRGPHMVFDPGPRFLPPCSNTRTSNTCVALPSAAPQPSALQPGTSYSTGSCSVWGDKVRPQQATAPKSATLPATHRPPWHRCSRPHLALKRQLWRCGAHSRCRASRGHTCSSLGCTRPDHCTGSNRTAQ